MPGRRAFPPVTRISPPSDPKPKRRGDASQAGNGPLEISVVTRTLGHRPFLQRCWSALEPAASSLAAEWIVVDDGADDPAALAAFIESCSESSGIATRLIASRARHRAQAANAGLAVAVGRFIHFLDDDDVVGHAFYAETRGMLLADERLGAAAVKCERVLERSSADGTSYVEIDRREHYPEVVAVSLAGLAVTQTVPLTSVLFRRGLVERIGGFDAALEVGEDYELLLRLLCEADIGLSPRQLFAFHQREVAGSNSAMTTDFATQIAYFRNAMLRKDLKEGRVGLGWLLAFGEFSAGSVKTERILSQLYRNRLVQNVFGLIRRRR